MEPDKPYNIRKTSTPIKRTGEGRFKVRIPTEIPVNSNVELSLNMLQGVAYWTLLEPPLKPVPVQTALPSLQESITPPPGKAYALMRCRRCDSKYTFHPHPGMTATESMHDCGSMQTDDGPVNYLGEGDLIGWNQDLRRTS